MIAMAPLRPLLAPLALALAGALWGMTFWLAKIALAELNFWHIVLFRFMIGTLALMPFALFRRAPAQRLSLPLVLLTGVLTVPLTFLLQFAGVSLTSATNAALIIGAVPVLTAAAGFLFLRERLSRAGWAAVLCSAVGVGFLVGFPTGSGGHWVGDGLILLSTLFVVASWIILSRWLLRGNDALQVTSAVMVSGTLVLIPVVLGIAGLPPLALSGATWAALVTLGIGCTAMTNLLWNWGLQHLPASRAGIFINVEPLVGALLGVGLLGEPVGAGLIMGGTLILLGANVMVFLGRR